MTWFLVRLTAALAAVGLGAACGGGSDPRAPASGRYRYDAARSDLVGQLRALAAPSVQGRPGFEALVAQAAAAVRGSFELAADGAAAFDLALPGPGGELLDSAGAGAWTLDGDKVTLTPVGPSGASRPQVLQLLGDALVLEEERQGVWIRLVFTRER